MNKLKLLVMIFEIYFVLHYRNRNVTKLQNVYAIDKTHALKIFWKWAREKFKSVKFIEIR